MQEKVKIHKKENSGYFSPLSKSDSVMCSFSCRTVITGQQYHKSYNKVKGKKWQIKFLSVVPASVLSFSLQHYRIYHR